MPHPHARCHRHAELRKGLDRRLHHRRLKSAGVVKRDAE